MKTKVGFLEVRDGEKSIGRLIFLILTIFAMGFTTLVYLKSNDATQALAIFPVIESLAIGLKITQNYQENKEDETNSEKDIPK